MRRRQWVGIASVVLGLACVAPFAVPSAARLAVARDDGRADPPPDSGSEVGSWAFNPPVDRYKASSFIDLRRLNEATSGATGFVQLSKDGESFVRGDGTPIRFWSVVSDAVTMSPAEMGAHCDFLAKRGVNMIRLHLTLCNTAEGAKITDLDEKQLDAMYRVVSIAKSRGIYVTLSPYWAAARAPKSWGIEDYDGQQLWGLLFFNPKLQEAYRAWVKEIYTRPNPYTKLPLKDDPTVAIAQLQNEDGVLFWTFQALRGAQKALVTQQFTAWAVKKYGSVAKAKLAWGKTGVDGDGADVLGLEQTWALTQDPPRDAGQRKRLADQVEFLARLQHDFNSGMQAYMRSLGIKQLINPENWRTADAVRLNDAERWSYTANDVSAVNAYTGGLHVGDNNGFRIDPGHYYTNVSALKSPEKYPLSLKRTVGHPMIVTECAWTHPNLYQSEGPLMAAAYMSLSGVNSVYWFAADVPTWMSDPRRKWWPVGDSFAVDKWGIGTPEVIGQFPACAIAFRRGYIKEADVVVHEERRLADLWDRRVPIISEEGRFDPNRDKGAFAPASSVKQEVDRLAYFVGPVEAKYEGDPIKTRVVNLSKYVDRTAGKVTSITGEISLNYKVGVLTVNAPKFQAVGGFLGAGGKTFALGDLTVVSESAYETVAAVSLDDQPLASSGRVLVQVGTTARLTGYASEPATFEAEKGKPEVGGLRIKNTGAPPWRVANTDATITLVNPKVSKAILLDANGEAAGEIPVTRNGSALTVKLPPNAMYVVLN